MTRDKDGGTVLRLASDPSPSRNGKTPRRDWSSLAAQYRAGLTDAACSAWAQRLQVAPAALREIGCGLTAGDVLTVPERDAAGAVVGITTRSLRGSQKAMRGGRRGLVVPEDLAGRPDPVLIPEGASDTCAALTLGLAAVGRPSARSGADLLAELVSGRDVLVVGEHDRGTSGRWPGREGAQAVAQAMANAWVRAVRWALPPEGSKDLRAWLMTTGIDLADPAALQAAGGELLEALRAGAVAVAPAGPVPPLDADPDDDMAAGAHTGPDADPAHARTLLRRRLRLDVSRVERIGGDRPQFDLLTAAGQRIPLGPAASVLNPRRVAEACFDAIGHTFAVPTYAKWRRVAEAIAALAEPVDAEDTEQGELRDWIAEVFDGEPASLFDLDDAERRFDAIQRARGSVGFRATDGRVYIRAVVLARLVCINLGQRLTAHELRRRMVRAGFRAEQLGARRGAQVVKVRLYVSPAGWLEAE